MYYMQNLLHLEILRVCLCYLVILKDLRKPPQTSWSLLMDPKAHAPRSAPGIGVYGLADSKIF